MSPMISNPARRYKCSRCVVPPGLFLLSLRIETAPPGPINRSASALASCRKAPPRALYQQHVSPPDAWGLRRAPSPHTHLYNSNHFALPQTAPTQMSSAG
jgi:hypothetical protein